MEKDADFLAFLICDWAISLQSVKESLSGNKSLYYSQWKGILGKSTTGRYE
jgi:hypothetical protein